MWSAAPLWRPFGQGPLSKTKDVQGDRPFVTGMMCESGIGVRQQGERELGGWLSANVQRGCPNANTLGTLAQWIASVPR